MNEAESKARIRQHESLSMVHKRVQAEFTAKWITAHQSFKKIKFATVSI